MTPPGPHPEQTPPQGAAAIPEPPRDAEVDASLDSWYGKVDDGELEGFDPEA